MEYKFLRPGILCTVTAFAGLHPEAGEAAKPNGTTTKSDRQNVLLIIVDDLRTELNCYGIQDIVSPNIDRLAARGVRFDQAYCNVPVSGASRASLMTGLRPTLNRFVDVNAKIDKEAPEAITLPGYFKQNGYVTISNSKVIHGQHDALDSWSSIWKPGEDNARWRNYLGRENSEGQSQRHGAEAYECLEVADNAYFDGMTADKTIEDLRKLQKSGQPFFLAVGIVKPHLPFNAPKKYWDLYDREQIALPENYRMDRSGFPQQAFHTWGELRFYKNIPDKGDIPDDEIARTLIHAYKACVSYADAQVGAILNELERLGLDRNTLVVLIGDHGWSLGDHGQWCKHSNFGIVDRAPMIFCGAGLPQGRVVNEVVEFVDLYPSICQLAGLPVPGQCQGKSLAKLAREEDPEWKNSAVVKWHAGVSLMTPRYHYTEWRNAEEQTVGRMLFDCRTDPEENHNVAERDAYKSVVESLGKQLEASKGVDFYKK